MTSEGVRRKVLLTAMILAAAQAFPGSNARRDPPRIVMIIAPKDFTDQEYFEPREVFERAGLASGPALERRSSAPCFAQHGPPLLLGNG